MNLSITTRLPYAPPVEFVERKGAGHPDTICDDLAERLARRLATHYRDHTGAVQHFNVDKALLAAGTANLAFGGGEIGKPFRVIVAGKADFGSGWEPDVESLIKEAEADLADILPDAGPDAAELDIWLGQSASDLALVNPEQNTQVPLANDTSFAAVSLPRSPLEEAVYLVERHLNGADFRAVIPVGRDIKVMGARTPGTARLTVAAPIRADRVQNRAQYDDAVDAVRDAAQEVARNFLGAEVRVHVNQADADDSPYLTLSGSSAEAGDDGQVGRGNRFGGLIMPYRPMSLEAAAGKNPAAHVGKTYHAVAHDIAERVLAETGAREVTVRLLSSIGSPVTEPQAAHVELVGETDESQVSAIVRDCLDDWDGVRDRLIAGAYELF